MLVMLVVIIISLCVLYLCYLALPEGHGALYGLAAVVTALGGLLVALTHLL
jgi:hypothetical protein